MVWEVVDFIGFTGQSIEIKNSGILEKIETDKENNRSFKVLLTIILKRLLKKREIDEDDFNLSNPLLKNSVKNFLSSLNDLNNPQIESILKYIASELASRLKTKSLEEGKFISALLLKTRIRDSFEFFILLIHSRGNISSIKPRARGEILVGDEFLNYYGIIRGALLYLEYGRLKLRFIDRRRSEPSVGFLKDFLGLKIEFWVKSIDAIIHCNLADIKLIFPLSQDDILRTFRGRSPLRFDKEHNKVIIKNTRLELDVGKIRVRGYKTLETLGELHDLLLLFGENLLELIGIYKRILEEHQVILRFIGQESLKYYDDINSLYAVDAQGRKIKEYPKPSTRLFHVLAYTKLGNQIIIDMTEELLNKLVDLYDNDSLNIFHLFYEFARDPINLGDINYFIKIHNRFRRINEIPIKVAKSIAKEAKNTPSPFIKRCLKALLLLSVAKIFEPPLRDLFTRILISYLNLKLRVNVSETERLSDVESHFVDYKTSINVIINSDGDRLSNREIMSKIQKIVEKEIGEERKNVGIIIIGVDDDTRNIIGYKRGYISQEFVRDLQSQLEHTFDEHTFYIRDVEILDTDKNMMLIIFTRKDFIDEDSLNLTIFQ